MGVASRFVFTNDARCDISGGCIFGSLGPDCICGGPGIGTAMPISSVLLLLPFDDLAASSLGRLFRDPLPDDVFEETGFKGDEIVGALGEG